MKITYPECQVEITAEEFITVIDYFMTKVTCNTEPTSEPGGIISTGDDMPAPKPYPNLTDHEAIVQRCEGFLNFVKQDLEEAEAQGKLPEIKIPNEERTAPGRVEIPIERKNESTKTSPKKKASGKPKKVQVLSDSGWKTFNSVSAAAKSIDARINHLNHALLNGKTCNGYHVRYKSDAPAFEPGGIVGPETEQPASPEIVIPGHMLPERVKESLDKAQTAKKRSYYSKKVDVQAEDGSWFTFDTMKMAAQHLGVSLSSISTACRKDSKVKGHAVRYHSDIDDIMAEIEASNKKPYQPTPPVR